MAIIFIISAVVLWLLSLGIVGLMCYALGWLSGKSEGEKIASSKPEHSYGFSPEEREKVVKTGYEIGRGVLD